MRTVEKKADLKNGVGRLAFTAISILLQACVIIIMFIMLNSEWNLIFYVTELFAMFVVLCIYSLNKTSAMKMPWIMLILAFPVFGIVLYLMIGFNGGTKRMVKRYEHIQGILYPYLVQDEGVFSQLRKRDGYIANISKYLIDYSRYPVYANTDVTYYPEADIALQAQLKELKKAEKFIFMEYHAIENAEAWRSVQDVLEERVKAGVEVRVFYDDLGSIWFINHDFAKSLEAVGIKCRVFNPVAPIFNVFLNNRDHRKITVIDGKVAFTGGYNMANEYFNLVSPYGYWKDTGIKIAGDAVKSLTITFLEMWNAVRSDDENDKSFIKYMPECGYTAAENGFVQPYADSPLDDEQVGENVYISLINHSEKYCWFATPYLIITDEMAHALGLAAKRGVDVRIITPGIPDKKIVYRVTRSFYNCLTKNGVKIYEYTPGFCHCKMCVSDDKAATCGTINLDYRSLYHHFENGCLYYGNSAVAATKKDFEEMMAVSEDVTEKYTVGRGSALRFSQLVLRLFAPLM